MQEGSQVDLWLISAVGQQVISEAMPAVDASSDPLSAAAALRRRWPSVDQEHLSAALTQATLRARARDAYGIVDELLLTRDGLEQATRPAVAALRGRTLARSGIRHVVDASAGLGFDTLGFLAAGMSVTSIESDPQTATFLRWNAPGAEVLEGDARTVLDSLPVDDPSTVIFFDPARRDHRRSADGARALPERDPHRWSPPWSFVEELSTTARVCAKVAPGFTAPPGWQACWTSFDRTVVEEMVCSWDLWPTSRRAVAVTSGFVDVLDVDLDSRLPVADSLGTYLHEPDPAVVRAAGIDSLRSIDSTLSRLDRTGTWLTSDAPSTTRLLRSFLVEHVLPQNRRERKRELARLGIESATVKTRDVRLDQRAALRELGLREGAGAVIVFCRRNDEVLALIVSETSPPQ